MDKVYISVKNLKKYFGVVTDFQPKFVKNTDIQAIS